MGLAGIIGVILFAQGTSQGAGWAEKIALFKDQPAGVFDPLTVWPHEKSDLNPDPAVIYGRLSNGLTYVLMNNKRPENRVSLHLNVQVGSMYESENERGIAHFLEHLLFCGSVHFKPDELVKYFQEIGMKFGPDVNASTGFYNTIYDIDLPKGDAEGLQKGLTVIWDYAAGALIPASEVDRERPVILAEKRTRDSADYRTFVEAFQFELPDALLPDRMPIGLEPVIEGADRALLKSFYDAWYRPERMTIVMAGDFDVNTALSLIKKDFSEIRARAPEKNPPDPGEIAHSGVKPFYHFEPEAGSTAVSIEVVEKRVIPIDSAELQRQELLSSMANQIINHRLSDLLDDPDTPFTSASISSGHYLRYLQGAEVRADCAPEKWGQTLAMIEQTLRKALSYGFTASEVDQVKKEFAADLDRQVKTASTRESCDLARGIISQLNRKRVFQSPAQRQALRLPFIEAADQKALHEALIQAWSPGHRLVLVTGNIDLKNNGKQPQEQILGVYTQSRKTAVEKPIEAEAVSFPYLSPPDAEANIISRQTISDLGVVCVEFENGVVLNIKKTDFEAHQVSAKLAFGYGRSQEPAQNPGLSLLAQNLINLSGLGRLTKDELKRALAGKNTKVSFAVEEDQFIFTGSSVSNEIPLLFQLLYAHIQDPGFRDDAYDLTIRQYTEKYENLSHEIDGGMVLEGRRFLAGGDWRFGLVDPDTYAANSSTDVRNWIGSFLHAAPMEISVVGDLDVEQVIAEAAIYFGNLSLKPKQAIEDQRQPSFPAGKSLVVPVPTQIHKGMVDVAYPTGDAWDIHRNRRLSVLSDILTDRIRIRIRHNMGAAYSYQAFNSPSRAYSGYGVLHALAQIDPDQADTVIGTLRRIVDDMVDNGVTPEELNRAVKPILTSIRQRLETNEYWLDTVLKGSSRHREQLDWSRTILSDYAAVTVDEVSSLAKTYLKNPASASVIVRPASPVVEKPPAPELHGKVFSLPEPSTGYEYPDGKFGG
jgi:zinc protease